MYIFSNKFVKNVANQIKNMVQFYHKSKIYKMPLKE